MEQLKEWVKTHRALAIGGGLAFLVLLYLWLRSGTKPAAQGDGSVSAYYAAQAVGSQSAAASQMSTDQLQASSLQTQAARDVALAQVGAAAVPYQTELAAITQQQNLVAYQDYLGETAAAGPMTPAPTTFGSNTASGTPIVFQFRNSTGDTVINTDAYHAYDINTGQTLTPGGTPAAWNDLIQASRTPVTWSGPSSAPTPYVPPTTAPTMTFAQFVASNPAPVH